MKDITYMPVEIKNIIYEYIPVITKAFLNKENYLKYHKTVMDHCINKESYIRDMIKRDNDFVFTQIINYYYNRWLKIKKYIYNNGMYLNYVYFVQDYCVEHESTKCKNVVDNYFEINGISKNQHKKNRRIDISRRWKI